MKSKSIKKENGIVFKTKSDFLKYLKRMNIPADKKLSFACLMLGHSQIISLCFGYVNCGRCGEQIGDRLMGIYDTTDSVIVGHACKTCEDNYKKLSWKDKLFAKNPFKKEKP